MRSTGEFVRRGLWLLALTCGVAASVSAQSAPIAKQVAAPAADILSGRVRLPDPASLASVSHTLMRDTEFRWIDGVGWRSETEIPIDASGPFSLALLSIDATQWTTSLREPNGDFAPIEKSTTERHTEMLEDLLPGWMIDRFDFASHEPQLLGLRIEARSNDRNLPPARGEVIASSASSIELAAHLSTLATLADGEIDVLAEFVERTASGERVHVDHVASSGSVTIETDSGNFRIGLFDDGQHGDGAAGDGIFGARIPSGLSGEVRARIELDGLDSNSHAIARSTDLVFPVLERRVMLSGGVTARVEDSVRERIELEAWPLGPAQLLQVSAEVWGTNLAGELVPACWLSRMLDPQLRGAKWSLALFLDARWLDVAHVGPPFELRQVRVQDPDTHVPFDMLERAAFEVSGLPAIVGRGFDSIAPEMLMGPASGTSSAASAIWSHAGAHAKHSVSFFKRALMLVHGYCSSGNIWPAADFAQPKVVFLDPNANRTNDQFAKLMLTASHSASLGSFGVVTHSQGGLAALQLYTYYHSGLDYALGPRLIQSLAAPYQGTPLASLGFFACGVNNDMTYAGATTWLAGIPSWARAKAYFWTTSDAGTHCNSLTALFLSDPEDGTVEKVKGQLPGGNSMGHVTGWCHTTGMTYPASYTDHTRNADMNSNAAR